MNQAIDSFCHLSPIQQGMLFHYLGGADAGVDIEQITVDYPEPVDAAAIRAAWEAEIGRQPVLRTAFRWKDVLAPLQEIHSRVELEWTAYDWSSQPEEESERAFEAHAQQDRNRGFDLVAPPLMRVALFRLGTEHYRMLWTFHHILIDGPSFVTILEEVDELYQPQG